MPEPFLPLVLFAVVSTLTPGAATTLITATGARFGLGPSLPLLAGAALGLASLGVVAGAGLAGLVLAVPSARLVIRLAGSAYLLWLAWRVGTSGPPPARTELATPPGFFGGAGLLWLNPKGWATSLAAASSFGAAADGPWQLAVLLGATLGLAAAGSLLVWCSAGQILGRILQSDRQWRALNAVLGTLLALSIIPMWLD